jgi:pimeloyl-ACP methyl ester carboxylesterase
MKDYDARLAALLAEGRRGDALALFMGMVGLPEHAIAGARRSPWWSAGEALAPTLAHDAAVMGDGGLPVERLAAVSVPTLVLAGGGSPAWFRESAEAAAAAIPGATVRVLPGQTHDVAPDVLARAAAPAS